jgi:Family of unknown function (DUF6600)
LITTQTMKRILLAVTILALVLPALRQAEAGVDVSIDFFYDNVGSDGSWAEVADYGYCWQPSIAASNTKWRPYSDGYWAYTDVGWTWVSYEDFGWATYHYGRWVRLRDRGWFWVPGREWGPAWVSWRTGGDYVGWAPLPPRGHGDYDDNRPINGHVDVEFDIGPSYYNFVDVRYIGEPVLRERIVEPHLNVTYISHTVNVTNITYTNSVVYNYGPDYSTLSRYSTRPIRRMSLERESNVDLSVAVKTNSLQRVQGDKLIVAAPPMFQKPAKPVVPKMVKEKIAKPTVERGWDGADPKAQTELKEKMKQEDPKTVAPPSFTPNANASPVGTVMPSTSANPAIAPTTPATAGSPATATVAPAASASPAVAPDKGKGTHASPMPTAAASLNPASSPATIVPVKPRKDRGETPAPTPNKPDERKVTTPSSLVTSPDGTPFREVPSPQPKKDKRAEKAPETMPPTRQPSAAPAEKAPRKPKAEATVAPNREAPPDASHTQPKAEAPQPVVTPKREAPPEVSRKQPKADVPPQSMAPPKHEAPPAVPPKQPPTNVPPKQQQAPPPPPAPGANEPVKKEAPPSKQHPDKKAHEPAPSPTS